MKFLARVATLLATLMLASTGVAQSVAVTGTAAVTDVVGSIQVETGAARPRPLKRGERLEVGDIIHVGPDSSAIVAYADGQLTIIGERSTFRVVRYSYDPRQPEKGEVFLQLIQGSMRLVLGEIGERNPPAVRVQVGISTVSGIQHPDQAGGADAGIVVQGAAAVLSVTKGRAAMHLASGQGIQLSAGEGVFVQSDGRFVRGNLSQITGRIGQDPEGKQLLAQLGEVQSVAVPERDRKTIIALVTALAPVDRTTQPGADAQAVTQALEKLPPPGAISEEARAPIPPPPPLATGTVQTSTGASGGGSQNVASPN